MMVETLYVSSLNKDGFTLKNGIELTVNAKGVSQTSKTFKSFQNVLKQTSFLQPFKVTCIVGNESKTFKDADGTQKTPKTFEDFAKFSKEFDKEVDSGSLVTLPVKLINIKEGQHDIVTTYFSLVLTKDAEITIDLIAHKSFFNGIVFGYTSFKLENTFTFKLESGINLIDEDK